MYKSYLVALFGVAPSLYSGAVAIDVQCNDAIIGAPFQFQTSDIEAMANDFATGNVASTVIDSGGVQFSPSTGHHFTLGSYQICMQDAFLFAGTHIALSDISSALQTIVDQCCAGQTVCQGGQTTLTGDTGLSVDLSSQNPGSTCNG
jgi:hypothetical protein